VRITIKKLPVFVKASLRRTKSVFTKAQTVPSHSNKFKVFNLKFEMIFTKWHLESQAFSKKRF